MKFRSLVALFFISTSITIAQTKQTLIQNVRLLDHKTGTLTAPMNVLISDQFIQKISPSAIDSRVAVKINGNGKTLIPGLIDVHVHMVFGSLTMAQMMAPNTSEEMLMNSVAESSQQMLMRGFTSVRDAGGPIFH